MKIDQDIDNATTFFMTNNGDQDSFKIFVQVENKKLYLSSYDVDNNFPEEETSCTLLATESTHNNL